MKDYVRLRKLRQREMFVPLAHPAGDAQADFGEALVVIGGEERKAHYLAMDLPQSDDCFVMAFPAETTEAFLEGHNQAFTYLEGVPRTILYDNTKLAVAKILGDGTRKKTQAFPELQSPLPVPGAVRAARQGKRQGKSRGAGGLRATQLPGSGAALRELGRVECTLAGAVPERRQQRLRGKQETIGERFEKDRAALLPLPADAL